jgi:hypothetical protein
MTDSFYGPLVDTIRKRVPAGVPVNPRVEVIGGNGNRLCLEHPQTGHRIYQDRNGRALTSGTAHRIGSALAEQLAKAS